MGAPTNYTFVATYYDSINGQKGNGNLVGISVGGAAIADHELDLNHEDSRYISYSPLGNFDSQQTGAIKFIYTSGYSDIPISDKVFFTVCESEGIQNNLISVAHSSIGGYISVSMTDSAGVAIFSGMLAQWLPVMGQKYEIELNYDFTAGRSEFYIQGQRIGGIMTGTGTRNSSIGLFKVGGTWDDGSAPPNNFGIKKLIIFSTVQHTGSSYTPGYCLGWVSEPVPVICPIFGFVKNPDNSGVAGIDVIATAASKYSENNLQVYQSVVQSITDSNGYWSLELMENETNGVDYNISFKDGFTLLIEYPNVVVPNTTGCTPFQSLIS